MGAATPFARATRCTSPRSPSCWARLSARVSGVHARRMRMLAKVPVLVIDDFALKPIRSPRDDDLHELVAVRYEQLPIIVTSNLAPNEWHEAFPDNKLLG